MMEPCDARVSCTVLREGPLPYSPTMSVVAIIYTSFTTIRQVDLKKIIAYSSVAHMNVVTIGLFSLNSIGIEGSLLLMLSHGIVSPALFLCVGVLYDRHKTRLCVRSSHFRTVMGLLNPCIRAGGAKLIGVAPKFCAWINKRHEVS